ncbi:FMN-binding protein MioC [Vibrio sp. SS-MA-C1-2]|uniref:FMN-binding protein MioC n=1 Tax=Vibrio sp. SS-MA-C1-2 TaxID=2908646 RepID=UPI001F3B44E0|nr:FMN-binding protein MioC [Vibrio sp. SS-MA-C1-2]UJF19330.1 FMN-binding protein MioC [Vibrio sp. SS-MA-C1-2]
MSKISIITGSTLGGSEYVGDHIAEILEQNNHQISIHNQPNLTEISLDSIWLIVCSTHGAGDYPDNILPFIEQLKAQTKLDISYTIIAIGDSSYDTFCLAGHQFSQLLSKKGANIIAPLTEIDVLNTPIPEEEAEIWLHTQIENGIFE